MIGVAGFVAALALSGCSGTRPDAEMVEVTGRVNIGGKPVARMILKLTPVTPGEGREDDCVVERGEYRARLIAGQYRVSFESAAGGPAVPPRYRSPDTSRLVLDGTKPGPVNFDLD
jgi:hypothetical protein